MSFQFHETKGGHEFYFGTMPAISRSLRSIAGSLEQMQKREDTDLKKFSEIVFDLTLIAHFEMGMIDEKDQPDLQETFDKVYALANEFYYRKDGPYKDTGNYNAEIEEFGRNRFLEFFGVEDLDEKGGAL